MDAQLGDIIHAGTVHKFQGIEYDVIIFDTVEADLPKSMLYFTKGGYDSKAMRLINVAVTRAKHKLIIVANRSYVHASFAENDTLRLAVEDAAKNATIKSKDILNIPFSTLSEAFERLNIKSIDKVSEEAKQRAIDEFFRNFTMLNEQNFFDVFIKDVHNAKKEIVIVSPFLTMRRTTFLLPLLKEKRKNGVKVLIVTKPLDEYDIAGREEAEQVIRNADIQIQHLRKIHSKTAIIDTHIVYDGSLNILSHKDTQESMLRLHSERFANEVRKLFGPESSSKFSNQQVRTIEQRDDAIIVYRRELPKLKCACGSDMIARIGRNGPFYGCVNWSSCTQKDKNRDITEEHLKRISRLTNVLCTKCASGTVMTIQISRTDIRLECPNPSCGCKHNIIITAN